MKTNRILWVLAVLAFASVSYAQMGGMGGQMGGMGAGQQQPPQQQQQQGRQAGVDTTKQMQDQLERQRQKALMQGPHPLTEGELIKEIKHSSEDQVIKDVNTLGVAFDMTPEIEKKLQKTKASAKVIETVRRAGPKMRATMAKLTMAGGNSVAAIPKEEAAAYDQIKGELEPDKSIAMVDDFVAKYPNSVVVTYVYAFGANAYQEKGNLEKVAEYTEKSLKANPDNLMSLAMRVEILPMPQYVKNHGADLGKILSETVADANHGLQLIAEVPRQPNETDEAYKKRQDSIAAGLHGGLGMVHLMLATQALEGVDKNELAKAEQEFNIAVTTASRPDPTYCFRLGEAYKLDGKYDDAIQAFTKAGQYGQGAGIKQYVDDEIAEVKKQQAGK
jgi:tetratricopeptide (TPR) repeat protein